MHKRTRALEFPPEVRRRIWDRDGWHCILCGSPFAMPNAHYIPRSQGGLGIEENGVTLCFSCHDHYDNGAGREQTKAEIRAYLQSKYPDWDEGRLTYQKYI